MNLIEHRLETGLGLVVTDHGRDCSERLAEIVGSLPAKERARFATAAKTAGEALELLKPGIVAMPREGGMIAGDYSEAGPGDLVVLAASGARSAYLAMRAADADEAARYVGARLAEPDVPQEARDADEHGGLLVLTVRAVLDKDGTKRGRRPGPTDAAWLASLVLSREEHREFARQVAAHRLVPALVCLLARDRRGAMISPIVHGRPFPVAAFAEAQGHG